MFNKKKIKAKIDHILFATSLLLFGCNNHYTPKPIGYFRIDLPEKKYIPFNPAKCPFAFDVPAFTVIEADNRAKAEPCWYDINYPGLQGKINLTYLPIHNDVITHIENCRTLAYKHAVKANGIDEVLITSNDGQSGGLMYLISGNAASSIQFFLTDSTTHFLRGALYFNCPPQSDSLAPVIEFCKKDIEQLIHTLQWKQ
ncbi:MAG: gliding motility lipoprotein GldD [Bacteroidia bacterium]|nr:gliding motility lipoprotein GldD [Bacteroidia bacterium]HQU99877.1 gliding motility lipoprotein GldD [Bacteroidia bacterium]